MMIKAYGDKTEFDITPDIIEAVKLHLMIDRIVDRSNSKEYGYAKLHSISEGIIDKISYDEFNRLLNLIWYDIDDKYKYKLSGDYSAKHDPLYYYSTTKIPDMDSDHFLSWLNTLHVYVTDDNSKLMGINNYWVAVITAISDFNEKLDCLGSGDEEAYELADLLRQNPEIYFVGIGSTPDKAVAGAMDKVRKWWSLL